MVTPSHRFARTFQTPHLKYLIIPFFFLIMTACTDRELRDSGLLDDLTPEEAQIAQSCEDTCSHVYDTCGLAFPQSDGTSASRNFCINACINKNFFRGNEACVTASSCDYSEIAECIRVKPGQEQEQQPDPDPNPDTNTSPPTTTCAEADTQWTADWKKFEDEVLVEVNRVRAAGAKCDGQPFAPAPPLKMEAALRCSSRLFSKDMAVRGFFDHTSPEGTEPHERIIAAGYTGAYPTGENIAAGYDTPIEVMNGWMKSPGHCRNIMNPEYQELGVGFYFFSADPEQFQSYWTQNFGGGRP